MNTLLNNLKTFCILSVCLSNIPFASANEQNNGLSRMDCMIQPNMTAELSSPVTGVIEAIQVDRSDYVKKGQVLANLKSDVEQVKYNMAQIRALYKGNLKIANVNLQLAIKEVVRARKLYKNRTIPLTDKENAEANLALAKLENDRAKHESLVLELELEKAKADLELRQIRSPIDGVVVESYMTPGEYVENKPVLKVAQLNPLRIEIISSIFDFGKIETGRHAYITPEFGDYDDLIAEVVVVDKIIDAASGTFGVRLLLDNENNSIPGGLKCTLDFFTPEQEIAFQKQQNAIASNIAVKP